MKLLIALVLVILILYFIYQSRSDTSSDLTVWRYDSKKPGPCVLFIGGVHGNEPAGSSALLELIQQFKPNLIKRGKIIIVPMANRYGLKNYVRSNGQILASDVNRNFTEAGPADSISAELAKLVDESDWVMDFHEGWGFHKISPKSIGSTLTSCSKSGELVAEIVGKINNSIEDPLKHFTQLYDICDIPTTLGCYAVRRNKAYILMETTGQNEIQPRAVRVKQILTAIDTLLHKLL